MQHICLYNMYDPKNGTWIFSLYKSMTQKNGTRRTACIVFDDVRLGKKNSGMVSLEVSRPTFTICLIMIDRLLAVMFPLHRHLHSSWKSASATSIVSWILGVAIALVLLLPFNKHWQFYRQNAICLPLPITRQDFPGSRYALSIFLVLNFSIFIFIGVGQSLIYLSVRQSSKMTKSVSSKDFAVARRLFVVVFSDFCCWFPMGVMGLMANAGVPIPGDVNVLTAIFVLPLNSALNPFLYTYSKYRQKMQRVREEKRYQTFVKRYQAIWKQNIWHHNADLIETQAKVNFCGLKWLWRKGEERTEWMICKFLMYIISLRVNSQKAPAL